MATSRTSKYANPDRLADVLALIQVLALHKRVHRSESGLQKNLQGPPKSAREWSDIAQQHPEFFRFRNRNSDEEEKKPREKQHRVSLVARHVLPEDAATGRELPMDLVGKLLDSAIHLHDREISRGQRLREILLPLIVALIGAVAVVWAAGASAPRIPAATNTTPPASSSR